MFMVLSSWHCHYESSPGSSDECSTSAWRLDQTMSYSRPTTRTFTIAIYYYSLLSPKADTHFTIPRRIEGWVDLCGWLRTETVYLPADSHGHPSTTRYQLAVYTTS